MDQLNQPITPRPADKDPMFDKYAKNLGDAAQREWADKDWSYMKDQPVEDQVAWLKDLLADESILEPNVNDIKQVGGLSPEDAEYLMRLWESRNITNTPQ